MLSRHCVEGNCFTCHQTATTCGAGLADWQLAAAAGLEVQGNGWPCAPRCPRCLEFPADIRVTCASARIWDFSPSEMLGVVSADRVSVRGCLPLPLAYREAGRCFTRRVLGEDGGCLLLPGALPSSSISFTRRSH